MTEQPGPLRRAGLLAGRQADRLPQDRGRLHPHRAPGRREPGHLPRPGRRRGEPDADHRGRGAARTSAPRATASSCCAQADEGKRQLVSRRPRRQGRARPPRQRERDRVPRLAGRPLGGLRRALQRLRDAVRRHRQGGRRRPQGDRRCRCAGSPATPASTCTGPATRRASTGRSARSSTPATSRTPSPSSRARPRSSPIRRPRA